MPAAVYCEMHSCSKGFVPAEDPKVVAANANPLEAAGDALAESEGAGDGKLLPAAEAKFVVADVLAGCEKEAILKKVDDVGAAAEAIVDPNLDPPN